jgi:DNA-binding CsgD family transcriptional regulator/tetratricopeptide (TPR) repeat protein
MNPDAAPVTLRGRSNELAAIDHLLAGALAGRGGALLFEGPAGIGKTTLLAAAGASAREQGFVVLEGCGDELETGAAWGIVIQLLGRGIDPEDTELFEGAAALARPLLVPTALADHAPADPFPLLHGLHWLTATLAERQPLLLVMDDVQWSDPLSLRFVHYLTRRVDGLRVAVLLGRRTGDPTDEAAQDLLERIAVVPSVSLRRVAPLTDDLVESMTRSDLPDADPAVRAQVVDAVAGNPFLYREVIGALRGRQAQPPVDAASWLTDLRLLRVRDTIRVRLGRFGPDADRLAAAVAVLGSSANPGRAAQLAEIDEQRAARVIDTLVAADILVASPRLQFVHPIIRQVVYVDIGDARRRVEHLAAAELLHRDGAPVADIANHLLKVDPIPRRWAVDALRSAAADAYASGAFTRAAALLAHALAAERRPQERSRMLLDLGRYEVAAGSAAAIERLQEALALVPQAPEHADIAWQLGDSLYGAGRFDDAAKAYERGLGLVAGGAPGERDAVVEARLLAGLHTSTLLLGSPAEQAVARIDALVSDPPASPSVAERTVLASAVGACALGRELHRSQVLSLADRVLTGGDSAEVLTRPLLEPVPSALIMCDQYDRATGLLDGAIERARRTGEIVAYASLLPIRAYALLCRGRLADAITDATDVVRLADEAPPASRQALAPARLVLTLAALARGDLGEAERAVDVPDAVELWGSTPLLGWYLHAVGHVHLARGRFEAARDAFLGAGSAFEAGGGTGSFCPWRSGAAQALHALGDPGAHDLVETELRLARRFGSPRAVAVALQCQARLARDVERTVELLAEARELLDGSEAELDRAGIEVEWGAALRRSGRRRDAREPLRRGMELARRTGARSVVDSAVAELESTGARRPHLSTSGVDALTPSERRVARMAASGQSNREIAQTLFVTRKTVEVHLTSAYRKLGIRSRAELAGRLD